MSGPLAPLRVLDLSRILAGPWAAQLLGDLGADVTKVEQPGVGDDTRRWGPPFVTPADGTPGDAAYYHCANRNKTLLEIDFSTPAGQQRLRELARDSDILIENYKVGALAKFGLDYASLSLLNPRLIYCSITGFGQTGPLKDRPGYDFLIQAQGGLMSITGEKDSVPGGGPQKAGVAVTDLMAGMYATVGILAALVHRDRTGEGQHIDLALLDCSVAMLANQNMNYLVGGKVPGRLGNAHPNIVPYQVFATADDFLVLAVGNDAQFRRFAELNAQRWAEDARFVTNECRVRHRDVLTELIETVMATRTTAAWIALLELHNIPCGPVNDLAQVFADPQVVHRQLQRTLTHADGTVTPTVANPLNFSKTPVEYRHAPPRLGPT